MKILPEEAIVGIETFFTKESGIGGILRTIPEDFKVIEQSQLIPETHNGPITIATITAKNWETNHLIRELSQRLHISKKRIHFAGTKDKRAVTTQQMSFYNVTPTSLAQIELKDVSINSIFSAQKRLHIGDLQGNTFTITIRGVASSITENHIQQLLQPITDSQGFPNFFGIQRFGITRPITHLVGKYIFQANFEQAVLTYLTYLSETEHENAYNARKELLLTKDYKKAFHEFPNTLGFEKILLQHLTQHPDDYIGALEKLPKNLLTMFIYAYQSYVFNRILSTRIKENLPLNQAINGDVILPIQNSEILDKPICVTQENLVKVNKQLKKGRGFVSSILPGSNTTYASGKMGAIEERIINEEHIDIRNFIIPELPIVSSYGTRRSLLAPILNFSYSISPDEYYPKKQEMTLDFCLRKGCYATSLLREIMKASDIRSY